jgi:ABC-type polysaccharide/polyol phosphate transport system ATPase subunit
MSEIAIKLHSVHKVFRIYDHPSDRLKEAFSLRRKKFHTDFHALRNVSFDVRKGEFLGIVGKNGAGKSTLLKILSRELTPTSGTVEINGKVSLLQLGVGFDPELTGIENARFASKLLGYSDEEIDEMLDEIIAFADIGEFIYHPVKTYSSGMYSRLSFAVGINRVVSDAKQL